jgi:SAM-dependent methyltransferase
VFGPLWPALYDRITKTTDNAGFGELRHQLVGDALGATIEIGAGTGANLHHYPTDLERLVLVEPDRRMLRRLRRRTGTRRPDAEVVAARAEQLPFPDGSFDTAVVTFVLSSVPDQTAALAEIRRILRPGGRILLAEHVRSPDPRVARRQDRLRPVWSAMLAGCNPNRDTLAGLRAAGFDVRQIRLDEVPNAPAVERPLIIGAARHAGA